MTRHRANFRMHKKDSKYSCSSSILFDKYGLDNCKIELIEIYPCENKEELRKREGYWIRHEDCVNKNIPDRSKQEWTEQNKERINRYVKEYCANHLLEKQKYDSEYYKKTRLIRSERMDCPICGITYTRQHQKRHERSQRHINALETAP